MSEPPPAPAATSPAAAVTWDGLLRRARALVTAARCRAVLGITGPPGAGKSTLAERVAAALGSDAVIVGMDGFHLANAELRRLGRQQRKGALDTFDGAGYAALLARLRQPSPQVVYAPIYDRSIEESVAAAVAVEPSVPLVITEGNYLLVESPPWDQVRPLLDEVWFCDLDDDERERRLVARHRRFGKSERDARRWVAESDAVNAQLVLATRHRADLCVSSEVSG